jgi:hypothetical protein
METLTIGANRPNRFVHVDTVSTRCCKEGGNQPFALALLSNRGARCRVFLFLLDLRIALRESNDDLTCRPRWTRTMANINTPFASLTSEMPVSLEPGSTLTRTGWTFPSARSFRMIVKGNRRRTAALPIVNSILALAWEVGISGFLVLLTTNTPFISTSYLS